MVFEGPCTVLYNRFYNVFGSFLKLTSCRSRRIAEETMRSPQILTGIGLCCGYWYG